MLLICIAISDCSQQREILLCSGIWSDILWFCCHETRWTLIIIIRLKRRRHCFFVSFFLNNSQAWRQRYWWTSTTVSRYCSTVALLDQLRGSSANTETALCVLKNKICPCLRKTAFTFYKIMGCNQGRVKGENSLTQNWTSPSQLALDIIVKIKYLFKFLSLEKQPYWQKFAFAKGVRLQSVLLKSCTIFPTGMLRVLQLVTFLTPTFCKCVETFLFLALCDPNYFSHLAIRADSVQRFWRTVVVTWFAQPANHVCSLPRSLFHRWRES